MEVRRAGLKFPWELQVVRLFATLLLDESRREISQEQFRSFFKTFRKRNFGYASTYGFY